QVKDWSGPGTLYTISSYDDAEKAINEIKRQGEGASASNPEDGDCELAHFYKFSQIVEGKRIVIHADGSFSYTGEPIPFDPDGVWAMMDDPDLVLFPVGSRAQVLSMQFAQTYQSLLNALHTVFNGQPDQLNEAIGLMYSLSVLARQLMETPSGVKDGT